MTVALSVIFVTILLYFLYYWLFWQERPVGNFAGYFGFYDQSQYLAIARDLAAGHLPSRAGYVYGLGYPLLAAPFIRLGFPKEPFLPGDAAAFAATMTMVAVIGARIRSLAFGMLCAAALTLASPLLGLTVQPWSSTITLVAVTAVLLIVTAPKLDWRGAAIIGLAIGICFMARYVDAAFPALIGYPALLWARAHRLRLIAVTTLIGAAIVVLVLLTHWIVLGNPLTTPYASHLTVAHTEPSDQDIRSYDLLQVPSRTIGAFITARQNGVRVPGQPLGLLFPWAILSPLGVAILALERHRLRGIWIITFATSVVGTVFYMSFHASGAGGLQFGFLHYFKVWFVVWGILAAYGAVRILDQVDWLPGRGLPVPAHHVDDEVGLTRRVVDVEPAVGP